MSAAVTANRSSNQWSQVSSKVEALRTNERQCCQEFVLYGFVKRPKFNPALARGDSFEGSLFDTKPSAKVEAQTEVRVSTSASVEPSHEVAPAPAPASAPVASAAPIEFTVTSFNELIGRTLDEGMRGSFRIAGEIANLTKRGHWYFSVKDAKSILSCVMWTSDVARVSFEPHEGDAVIVTGRISHYPAQGRTQLYATKLEPQGVGELELRFQQLVKELREKGYFLDARKKALPANPRRVAIVTSAKGAALHDVLKTAKERGASVEFLLVDVRVQGEGAAAEVARALRALDRRRIELGIDAVIVTRGGGSREDLWAFNERIVADAAFAMHLPLVAAIGHEVDTSVIELVADRRASTPTQAVMLLLPDSNAMGERCERLARDLRNTVRWSLQSRRDAVNRLAAHSALASPVLNIARARQRLTALGAQLRTRALHSITDERRALDALASLLLRNSPSARAAAARAHLLTLAPRLHRATTQRMTREHTALSNLERRLRSAGPDETLQRGYAIVTTSTGALVRGVAAANNASRLEVQFADGRVRVQVDDSHQSTGDTHG